LRDLNLVPDRKVLDRISWDQIDLSQLCLDGTRGTRSPSVHPRMTMKDRPVCGHFDLRVD